jgi:HSP20 family molecular chaperone IbpA
MPRLSAPHKPWEFTVLPENGVLTIALPRVEESKPRRIQIGNGDTQQVTRGQ